MRFVAALVALLAATRGAAGHGMMVIPASRNVLAHAAGSEDDPHGGCCRGGGPDAVYGGGGKFPIAPKLGSACGDAAGVNKYGSTGTYGRKGGATKVKTGSTIDVKITLTANHYGSFVFSLCPGTAETLDCFSKNRLALEDGKKYYKPARGKIGDYTMRVKLPASVTGPAVLQWRYITENSCCLPPEYGGEAGCNMSPCTAGTIHPEEFWNCGDLQIGAEGEGRTPGSSTPPAAATANTPAAATANTPSAATATSTGATPSAATATSTGATPVTGAAPATAAAGEVAATTATATATTTTTLSGLELGLIGGGNGVVVVALGVAAGMAGGAAVGGAVGVVLAAVSALLWYFLYYKRSEAYAEAAWARELPSPPPIPASFVVGGLRRRARQSRVAAIALEVARNGALACVPAGELRDAVRSLVTPTPRSS